ncbi:MAG: hypothetical protein GF421_01185 [Candidatus Aminicenantes bacterium]|nr:hypothetical protein [Candidatus Aminicenantes bacterium]
MNTRKAVSFLFLAFLFVFQGCGGPSLEKDWNPYDYDLAPTDKVRLCILHPSTGSLNSLIKLKQRGIFGDDSMEIVGVFHGDERTDYQRSLDLVKKNNYDWIKFYPIKASLKKDSLFQKNSLSSEFKKIVLNSDGIIFFGGADIPPSIYGEKTELLTSIRTPVRHWLELSFVFHLLGGYQNESFTPLLESRPDFPVLGICLGEQTLNVGTGGSMVQDIWSEKYGQHFLEDVLAMSEHNWHTNPFSRLHPEKNLFRYNLHPVKLSPEGIFVKQFGLSEQDTPLICSSHHQAVDELGKGMAVCATTMDGRVIEAIQHKKFKNVLGIQFHPEFPILWDPEASFLLRPDDQDPFTPLETLKSHPPSYSFHQKIWTWFEQSIKAYHQNKQKE